VTVKNAVVAPLAKQLGETDRQGRIIVNEDLSFRVILGFLLSAMSPIIRTKAENGEGK
jgi:hypothetical protein